MCFNFASRFILEPDALGVASRSGYLNCRPLGLVEALIGAVFDGQVYLSTAGLNTQVSRIPVRHLADDLQISQIDSHRLYTTSSIWADDSSRG